MSKTIKRDEVSEETIFVFVCPECSNSVECEDPAYAEEILCNSCGEIFKLED